MSGRTGQECFTGECHGGPLDGDTYTKEESSFVLDVTSVAPSLHLLVQSTSPPVALQMERRVGWYRWHFGRARWEWQGWEEG